MSALKTSKCGEVMHDVRNGLDCIEGVSKRLDNGDPRFKYIYKQITRISRAVDKCDANKSNCGVCQNGSEIK